MNNAGEKLKTMELRDLFKLLARYRFVMVRLSLLGAGGGLLVSLALPSRYQALVELYVQRTPVSFSEEVFDYEGYYAQLSSRDLAEVVVAFAKSRSLVREALGEMSLPQDSKEVERRLKTIKVRKMANSVVSLEVKASSPEEASGFAQALVAVVSRELSSLTSRGDQVVVRVSTLSSKPLVKEETPPLPVNILVGFMGGLGLAVFWVSVKEYLG